MPILDERRVRLRGVTIVGFDDAAELLLAANSTLKLWLERLIQHVVRHAHSPMGPECIVIGDPGRLDVVELVETEADKVVQTLPLMGFDPRFRERIRAGRPDRYSDTSHASRFPEGLEFVRELAVTVMDQKARLDSHVVEPHIRVA